MLTGGKDRRRGDGERGELGLEGAQSEVIRAI